MEKTKITDGEYPQRSGTFEVKVQELFKGNCKVTVGKQVKHQKQNGNHKNKN